MLLILLSPFAAAFALSRTVRRCDLFVVVPVAVLTSVAAFWRVVTTAYPTVDLCGVGDVYLLSSAVPAIMVGGAALFTYTAAVYVTVSSRSPVGRSSFTRVIVWWGAAAVVLVAPVTLAVVTGEAVGWDGTSIACLGDLATV